MYKQALLSFACHGLPKAFEVNNGNKLSFCEYFKKMDNNFKFKTRHVSIVQRLSSVVNSITSSAELITAMAYKLKRDTIQNLKKLMYNFKMRETLNKTCTSTTLNTRKKIVINS